MEAALSRKPNTSAPMSAAADSRGHKGLRQN